MKEGRRSRKEVLRIKPPVLELNNNDITSSSVETEKATYEVKKNSVPEQPKLMFPAQIIQNSEKKMNPEKVFAYNKYLGAMHPFSPDEFKMRQGENDDIHFTS